MWTNLLSRCWIDYHYTSKELWQKTNQPPVEEELKRTQWRWIGHTLRKLKHNITRQALQWNPQGKRGRRRPRNTWRRDSIAEMEIEGYRWQDLEYGTKQNTLEDCRQWHMHHQGVTGVSSKHTSNIYIYQTTVMTFEETKNVDKYSIVQRKSWRQRQSWKWISVQAERIERHSEKKKQ